jgi:oligoribonuclease NrnB/cAMP/cGMP phosphodiesterase (DHH superfamily)
LVNELNLDPRTHVKIKNIDVEVLEGDLEEKPWFIESEEKNYILLEEEQYDKIITLLKNVLEENLEMKMERRILSEYPIDLEDVKAVVKKEIKENNIDIVTAINKVKKQYPNLFQPPIEMDLETFFKEIL